MAGNIALEFPYGGPDSMLSACTSAMDNGAQNADSNLTLAMRSAHSPRCAVSFFRKLVFELTGQLVDVRCFAERLNLLSGGLHIHTHVLA